MTEEKKLENEGPAAKPDVNHRHENFRGGRGKFSRFGGPRHQRDRERDDRHRPAEQVNFPYLFRSFNFARFCSVTSVSISLILIADYRLRTDDSAQFGRDVLRSWFTAKSVRNPHSSCFLIYARFPIVDQT